MPIVLAGLQSPLSKKVRISAPPHKMQPKFVDSHSYIPDGSSVRRDVAYYTGRQVAAPLNIAPPVLLCVPEFGLVHDAMLADPRFMVAAGPRMFKVCRAGACCSGPGSSPFVSPLHHPSPAPCVAGCQ